ncbi:putative proteolipid membrane potential modulator [Rosa chinensis]|uniref:Putative proteolipid membrane potential modulator n=1 Tax=Rosa chinensis TaxID=74649 RepID=A0A2P6P739_ROSCH|nr:putative proteolipid membrane potential modulator [Rosa chinensis]
MPSGCEICCEIVLAVLLPPLGVCPSHGCCTVEFLICLLLTCLGYLPGIISRSTSSCLLIAMLL